MILLIYTIFTVIAGSGGDSSDDDETPTIDINALNAEILLVVKAHCIYNVCVQIVPCRRKGERK